MVVRGSSVVLIFSLLVIFVNGGTKFRRAQNLTSDEDLFKGDGDDGNSTGTVANPDHVDFEADHHHHANETVLSPTVLRWIPGGISVGIFFVFTIAATISTQMNQPEEKKDEGNAPDIADANFFEIDVVAKLKKKDNIFQRHLTQQKNRKFDLYNGMMRQYKDEIIAKRAQEVRHAELQKLNDQKKREREEASLQKLGPLARKIMEEQRGSSAVQAPGSSPTLRNRSLTNMEDSLLKPEGLAVPPPRSRSEGDATTLNRSQTVPSFRHNVFQDDEKDQGIMIKMKSQDDHIPVINEETTFTSDGKQILHDLQCARLYSSVSVQEDEDPEDKATPTYLAPLKKTDTSTEKIPLEDFSSLPRRKKENVEEEKIEVTPEPEQESKPVEDIPNTDASPESKEETPQKKDEGFIPKWKKRMSRPFTWFYGGDDEYECPDDTEGLVSKFREENEERKKSRDEEEEKIDGLIDQFVQNAIASREVQTPGPSTTEDEPVIKRRTSSRREESRPFTWFSGFSPPEDYYFPDESTDSITELIAQFMNLGPPPLSSKAKKRKQEPIKMTEQEEEKMLGEMEKRIIEGINEDQDKSPMPMSDVIALERILDEYSKLVKEYSSDKDEDEVFE